MNFDYREEKTWRVGRQKKGGWGMGGIRSWNVGSIGECPIKIKLLKFV